MANNRLDIVIFGATGFTGKYVVKSTISICKEQKMKFGIAGRRKEALEAVATEFGLNIEDVHIILADIKDEDSLKKMTERAKVLINCAGPFRFYGEPVVKACIATHTNYVDITGENEFMMKMQLEYNEAAKEAGIYVVSACGFDCIPADLGVVFTQQKFGGDVNAVEVYGEIWSTTRNKGSYFNYGTWESMIYEMTHTNEQRELHEKLYPTKLPKFTPVLKPRCAVHRSDVARGWSVPFPSADRSIILRTQRFLYDKYNERPAQVQVYATFKSFRNFLKMTFVGACLILTRMACGRNLLLKHPSFFSFGFISHENPNPEIWKTVRFSVTIKARGWIEKLAAPTDKHTNPPNKVLITKATGSSPAYDMTSNTVVLSAVTIINEADKMPDNGGVLTPGAAFGKTSLIEQLNKRGIIKFEIINSQP